ncbi:TIGR00730 family Rossman fold protein [Agromyces protaetiae]|uniref:TIGR00730 family Rossman fold protein n=1 Tax=Agromyces protaetiae TaxID=2509455 RepID=A0A4P6FDY4_9MICO|nr:TIGR00730 family Rossman fold protein [Agromyces protaetiae]QAY74420.1 TIGR00730 family Rossman fold protein [Agromyces protaetiae]
MTGGELTDVAADLRAIIVDAGITDNVELVARILATGVGLGEDGTERLDLKIAAAALSEMRSAFRLFAPYRDVPKVTVFGSARTKPDDAPYRAASEVAAALAERGWMVVTGAGPGIMQAAAEGAGADRSLGVAIRLPFEEKANSVIAQSANVVSMKYFFTRKLMLVKESRGFVCVPGGFGTLDEMFELLTLQQTGKAEPVPIVLLDEPGGTFWTGLKRFVDEQLVASGVVSPDDLDRVLITDSVEAAAHEITDFWRNYDSLRWVGDRLVLRLRAEPTDGEVASLNERFGDLLLSGAIKRRGPLKVEREDDDRVELPRLVMRYDQHEVGSLFHLIRAINELASAPAGPVEAR